ncbi:MAG TPA: AAA family ATPase, partial [Candidatus Acidoferrales bacterium]|nr:AAA family ATPase [Candidatus Acidoferrales bacterium]
MFLKFYGLREQPFGVTPDPRYLYLSPTHREALASLFCGIETGRGFLALLAKPGMGKTTLLLQLLERRKNSVRSAFLFNTQCNSHELLQYVLDGLGLDSRERDLVRMHGQLNEFLFREALAGRRVALVIDEAQNLSDSVLETVRLLTNFEAPDRKLLQIILAGQPELAQRLLDPRLGQLRQRIAIRACLDPLPTAEVVRYIHHRLRVAGYGGPELFTPAALALIAERSQGIPRNINNICFNALSLGCATGSKQIGPEIVHEAAGDLSFESLVPQAQTAPRVTPAHPKVRQFSYAATGDDRPGKWLFRTAALAAMLGLFAVHLGQGEKAGTSTPSSALLPHIAAVERRVGSDTPPAPTSASII